MKRLDTKTLGKSYLEQCEKITIKWLFQEIERELREKLLQVKLDWVEIVHTKANFGWYRKWFLCPSCQSKVFTLYKIWGSLKCRECSWLMYKSQKYSKILEQKVSKSEKTGI